MQRRLAHGPHPTRATSLRSLWICHHPRGKNSLAPLNSPCLQVDNPADIEDLTLTIKSDFDAEDNDWLISVRTQAHWLKHLGVDLSKSGYTWKSYDQNYDVFSKILKENDNPLEEQAARLQALVQGYSSVLVDSQQE